MRLPVPNLDQYQMPQNFSGTTIMSFGCNSGSSAVPAFTFLMFSGMRFFGNVDPIVIGPDGKGKFRLQVDIPFDYQEIK